MRRSVVLSGMAAALVLAGCARPAPPPTDGALIAAFEAHKDLFHEAVAEFDRAPGIEAVTLREGQASPKAEPKSADPARAERLARILRSVGATSVAAGETGPDNASSLAVRFAYLAPTRWGSKAVKGIVYDRAANPQDQVPDTDAFARRGEKAKYLYVERRIEGDWYIYQWLD
ncbi:hypothetical protein [Phenylobacterium aquaticum]|uniref:hypothetical protein n=1 Tax=Phenylobacterium aquaticum TaxID=1763816 RepID=UPI0026EFAAA5|nr:hypothetical protein [Phenylobacterium aquaticum]